MHQWTGSALVQIMLVAPVPSPYLNQCWNIVNWTLRNKLQWNSNQNTKLFVHENACENVVWEMAAILSWGRWVKCQILATLDICRHLQWAYMRNKMGNYNRESLAILTVSLGQCKHLRICHCHWKKILRRHVEFIVNPLSADDLAPWVVRTSAGMIMTIFRSYMYMTCIYTKVVLEGLKLDIMIILTIVSKSSFGWRL